MNQYEEIDAQIAEKVMGLVPNPDNHTMWRDPSIFTNPFLPLEKYSIEIDSTMKAISQLHGMGPFSMEIKTTRPSNQPSRVDTICSVFFENDKNRLSIQIDRLPSMAICKAILEAIKGR